MSSSSLLLLTVLLMGYIYWSLAQPTNIYEIRCKLKPVITDPKNECRHGTFTNPCGNLACLSGPGEICADTASEILLYGKCNHDLLCCNGQCRGCTAQGHCFDKPCHPPKMHGMQLRSDPYMPHRRINPLYAFFDYYGNE